MFYLILELQSKIDYTMPIRMLFYVTELLRRIFNDSDKKVRERKSFRMPAVVPIILYIGKRKWNAEKSYRNYTKNCEIFGDQIIDFKYSMLDLCNIDSKIFENGNSILDAIFLANKKGIDNDVGGVFHKIARMLPNIPKILFKIS